MKAKIFFLATTILIFSFSMIWVSCEKDNETTVLTEATALTETTELTSINASSEIFIPESVSAYLSEQQITAIYNDAKATSKSSSEWKLVSVFMKARTTVTYTGNPKLPSTIVFKGNGKWKGFGDMRYYEKVILSPNTDPNWTGKGSVLLKKKAADVLALENPAIKTLATEKNELSFSSGYRTEKIYNALPEDNKLATPIKVIESKLHFTGGSGMFKGSYGKGYKLEKYFKNKPFCEGFVFGLLWIKNQEEVVAQADYEVK